MKKILIAILTLLLPVMGFSQDNTWERIEVEESSDKTNPDAKYLVMNAVPEVDGKVCFSTTIEAPGKSARDIYDILLRQLTKMTKEPNQLGNSAVAVQDTANWELGAVFNEWLVFKSAALSLDRTQMKFQLLVNCADGRADVRMTRISYLYDTDRKPLHYQAEEWITDKYCVNKKRTKLYPVSGKFRRKTIDRKDFIFSKFDALINAKE